MAYPTYLREKARSLRRNERLSLDEIALRLALSRSTVYYWIRDLPLGRPRQNNAHPGTKAMCANYRRKRDLAYARGRDEFEGLATEPTFRDFVCLYIAEGYRRDRNVASLANSDPAVVKLAAQWIRRLSSRDLVCSVQFHADQNPEELARFWAAQLGVDPALIRLQRKSNSSGLAWRKWRCQYGVVAVRVSDTEFRAKLQAWMDSMKGQWLDSAPFGA